MAEEIVAINRKVEALRVAELKKQYRIRQAVDADFDRDLDEMSIGELDELIRQVLNENV